MPLFIGEIVPPLRRDHPDFGYLVHGLRQVICSTRGKDSFTDIEVRDNRDGSTVYSMHIMTVPKSGSDLPQLGTGWRTNYRGNGFGEIIDPTGFIIAVNPLTGITEIGNVANDTMFLTHLAWSCVDSARN